MLKKIILLNVILQLLAASCGLINHLGESKSFDKNRAFALIKKQLSFGPRYPGSPGQQIIIEWLQNELIIHNWNVQTQQFVFQKVNLTNIIAKKGNSSNPIILGAHFDTRRFADRDPIIENQKMPVPGADDGASGVAVLLELARLIDQVPEAQSIWLVFFDGEDQGEISGWDWSQGSTYFVNNLDRVPKAAIIVDMIGDRDLNLFFEGFSDQKLHQEIWGVARMLGYGDHFISENKYALIDDHKPFLNKGIPAVLLIDFKYSYWHSTEDTTDKLSADSLKIVGDTILKWFESQN